MSGLTASLYESTSSNITCAKQRRLLRSVEQRAEADDPDAVVSTAYYAMFHAACAIVLQQQGRLPKTHTSLIGQFGLIVRDLDAEGREFGAALNDAFESRVRQPTTRSSSSSTRAEAMKASDKAREFIGYCRKCASVTHE